MTESCWRLGCGRNPDGTLHGPKLAVEVCRQHGERWEKYPRWEKFLPYESASNGRSVGTGMDHEEGSR